MDDGMVKEKVLLLIQLQTMEKEMATPSSILAWRIPWTEESGSYSPWVVELDTTEQLTS